MKYILMDESGDLGTNLDLSGTSRHFIITFLITENKRVLDKIVKKVYTGLSKTAIKHRKSGVLHAYYEDDITIKRMLSLLAKTNTKIITIRLDKRKMYFHMEKTALYNHITNTLLNKCLEIKLFSPDEAITFIPSKVYTNVKLNNNFLYSIKNDNNLIVETDVKPPYTEKGLQVVDFVSWSLYQKYEREISSYSDIIADIIVGEYELYK